MNGLVYTINKLGELLATTEQALVATQQENEVLRARVTELELEADKSPEKPS